MRIGICHLLLPILTSGRFFLDCQGKNSIHPYNTILLYYGSGYAKELRFDKEYDYNSFIMKYNNGFKDYAEFAKECVEPDWTPVRSHGRCNEMCLKCKDSFCN